MIKHLSSLKISCINKSISERVFRKEWKMNIKKLRTFFAVLIFVLLFPPTLLATDASVTATISAANSFSKPISACGDNSTVCALNVSVSGTFVGTVTLQRKFPNDAVWHDVTTWTTPVETKITDYEHGVFYRIGIALGEYTSGSAIVRLSR